MPNEQQAEEKQKRKLTALPLAAAVLALLRVSACSSKLSTTVKSENNDAMPIVATAKKDVLTSPIKAKPNNLPLY